MDKQRALLRYAQSYGLPRDHPQLAALAHDGDFERHAREAMRLADEADLFTEYAVILSLLSMAVFFYVASACALCCVWRLVCPTRSVRPLVCCPCHATHAVLRGVWLGVRSVVRGVFGALKAAVLVVVGIVNDAYQATRRMMT